MLKKIQRAFALSERGAKDLTKGSVACVFRNLALMSPAELLYYLVRDLLTSTVSNNTFYVVGVLIYPVLIFITTYFQYNATFFAAYIESGAHRISLAEKLRKIPPSFFGRKDLTGLTNTIMADCVYLETSFSHYIPMLLGLIVSTAVVSPSLFILDWRMVLASLWVIPVSFLIVTSLTGVQDALSQKQIDVKVAYADGVQECLESVRDSKSNSAEQDYPKDLNRKIRVVEKRATVSKLGTAMSIITTQLVLKIGITIVTLTGPVLLVDGMLDVPTFFIFLLMASRLYDPFQATLQNFAAVPATRTHMVRMNEILDHPVQSDSSRFHLDGRDIAFDHVAFAYNGEEDALRDVSFTAKQGEMAAPVGSFGGGETTVSRPAAHSWDASQGKITLDGGNVLQVDPGTLLPMYATVFRDITLLNNTVVENIHIRWRNTTDEKVITAARTTRCDKFTSQMPKGYQTMIGESGMTLSGGGRQRISIARALFKGAPTVLPDEATASLDVGNETLIQSTVSELVKNKTALMIAHRMRTVTGTGKIVVLPEGTVAEQGIPAELMKQNGIYHHMVRLRTRQTQARLGKPRPCFQRNDTIRR